MGDLRKRTVAVLATTLIALGACAPPTAFRTPDAPGGLPAPEPPKVLTVAVREIEGSLAGGLPGIVIPNYGFITAGLAYHDETDTSRPLLAERLPSQSDGSWIVNADGTMRTTYLLRSNLKWADGQPLSAADYVFQHSVAVDPELPLSRSTARRLMTRVAAPDDRTLEIHWSQPFVEANQLTDDPLPRHLLEEVYGRDKQAFLNSSFWTTEEYISAGPYRITRIDPGTQILLAANPHFALGKPSIETVVVKIIPDVNTIVANMLAGSLDFVANKHIKAPEVALLRERWAGDGAGQVYTMDLGQRYLEFQHREVPNHQKAVTDLRVRRALLHSVDRETLGRTVMAGFGGAADTGYPKSHPIYPLLDQAITKYPSDLRQAQALLGEAGWTKSADGPYRNQAGQTLDLELWAITDLEPAIIVADWKAAGINATLQVLHRSLVEDAEHRATFPSVTLSTGTGHNPWGRASSANAPSPANRFRGSNRGSYVNPEFDRLYDLTLVTLDSTERMRIQVELERIATADVALGMLFYEVQPAAALKHLKGVKPRQRAGFAWNVWEWTFE